VSKGYEFYFNFMWAQREDNVAGIAAIKYFESLKKPFIGIPSRVLEISKADFCDAAHTVDRPRVPGNKSFPKIVKPSRACASMFLDQQSICHNETEL
jgi:hypothetical protein